ncbi:precorrin-6y C5,15-methyltransferase (decarboxylating) subunit CbiE [Spirilliplanes yamanashiensis]|uniref:Precorrin-6Y C(5,15)-methyltransferase [decarboxylating] n=1 Tax=Spirilliplanes yamanashiensis TaxID=42233 RepID=A0A8J4DIY8_9ACTN|nr:precorrin-6y C5,15-methyltransferase (decarboxylating) subunit CbiE [Spirilliplanes yamanashiensis]MDP9817513.1 precorrin-6Y C5,15-methyltransferase (decarboxylating) [Spirilliplanes yamanashiensis]GIJ02834.1 precorrin-6Y C(5,15)-methyltransferase [decarboxylating] [Spirilliplanes yamanashiensis]
MLEPPVTVVGVGADGWAGLGDAARAALTAADVVLGAPRQLGLLPAAVGARREAWPSPLVPALPGVLAAHRGRAVCVLASGDPMWHGIGATLAGLLGPDRLRVLPHPSSASLAAARLGWRLDDTEVVSLVTAPVAALHPAVQPGRRVLVLGADVAQVAALLTARGYGDSPVTVLEQLGGPAERVLTGTAAAWPHPPGDPLRVVAVRCVAGPDAPLLPTTPGLPDDAYDSDGQLTKREVRAVTLARLAPAAGQLLWDVGAGSGSIAIEWLRAHPANRAVAVEPDPVRAARIGANAEALGVPRLTVVTGRAPQALAELAGPADAVFVGGGVTAPGMVDAAWAALAPGGRLVANAVTIESEQVLAAAHARLGGDLTRLAVHRAAPVGGFTGWRPLMPVTIWAVTRP